VWQCPRLVGGGERGGGERGGGERGGGERGGEERGEGEGIEKLDSVRKWVQYAKEIQVCWKCGVIERLYKQQRGSSSRCRWGQVVIAALCRMREAGRAKQQIGGESVGHKTQLGRSGYVEQVQQKESKYKDKGSSIGRDSRDKRFRQWIGQVYRGRRIGRQVVSNGIRVVIEAILKEEK
jgi:hypothetical protein